MNQYLVVSSHQTFKCSSPGAPVDERDGGNSDAELAYGNDAIVNVHRDAPTDKISSKVVLGLAFTYDVKFIPVIWVYVSIMLDVARDPNFLNIHKALAAGIYSVHRFDGARIDGTYFSQASHCRLGHVLRDTLSQVLT